MLLFFSILLDNIITLIPVFNLFTITTIFLTTIIFSANKYSLKINNVITLKHYSLVNSLYVKS